MGFCMFSRPTIPEFSLTLLKTAFTAFFILILPLAAAYPATKQNKGEPAPSFPTNVSQTNLTVTNVPVIILSNDSTNISFSVMTNTAANTSTNKTAGEPTNSGGPFVSEVNILDADPGRNMIFDSYDEVIINNIEKQNLTHIKFIGNVKIRFDNNMLKARTVIITSKGNKVLDISAFEKVEFLYGGNTYLADFLSFNPETKKGILKNVRSFMGGGTGGGSGNPFSSASGTYYKAKKVSIIAEDKVIMEDVYFTFTPAEYPEYEFFAQRLWYYKGDIIYALFDSYTVGQANFIWFPFFLKWDKFTTLKTSFGREKRIGWYLMNSMGLEYDFGNFDLGLDIYERLGQYFTMTFRNRRAFGVFNNLSLFFEGANDNRLFHDWANDRYSQVISVNGHLTNISQLSMHYILNASLGKNDTTMSLRWEDLNDPFFISKYQQRRYSFDMKEILQYFNNYYYNHDDSSPSFGGFTRNFSVNYKNFRMDGNWGYTLTVNPEISNIYLNDYYKFYLSSVSFPNMSFSFDQIDLLNDLNYSFPVSRTIYLSNTNITVGINENIDQYVNANVMTVSNTGGSPTNADGQTTSTNYQVIPLSYSVNTNSYKLWSISSFFNANVGYNSQEYLDTNAKPTSDNYYHNENVSFSLNGAFLNGLLSLNNTFSFFNRKRWSTFTNELVNNMNYSGNELDLSSSAGIGGTPVIMPGDFWQISIPLSLSQSVSYQIFRNIYVTTPRTLSLGTSASAGVGILNNEINYSLSMNYSMVYRATNIEDDVYLNNMLSRSASANTTLKVYWLTLGTGVSLDLLETKTNYLRLDYTTFTNRILPGASPKLSVGFHPPVLLQMILPLNFGFDYLYDIIKETNVNLSTSLSFSVAKIYNFIFYQIEALNFSSSLYWDFLSPRSTSFNMSFSTTIWFNPTWKMSFSTTVRNSKIYRYYKENALLFGEPYVDFWENLKDSLNIFNYDGLKRGFFKIQGLSFDLTHFLNEWEMHLKFDLNRIADAARMIAYWEPVLSIEFRLSGTDNQFPPYQKKFVPAQYQ
jgi:hypothetical protein